MIAVLSVLVVLALSILVTRIATIALTHTGLARESARFQARSAFTGVGFTTNEAESVVTHPVRRRIIMVLMLLGNAGIVTVISSLILSFVQLRGTTGGWLPRIALLAGGIALLWAAARSAWVDRWLSRAIEAALRRWTDVDVRDYAALLHVSRDYRVTELRVRAEDWLASGPLRELKLRSEGINVLGVSRVDGHYVGTPDGDTELHDGDRIIVYGRNGAIRKLNERRRGSPGDREHDDAVQAQREADRVERQEED